MRWLLLVPFQAVSTSASGTGRASIWKVPLVIAAASPGSSARMSRVGTEPWPLPTISGKAVFYPDDEQFLIERDLTVHHYEVAATE